MTWDQLKNYQIKVYSSPSCGDCRRLKNVLKDRQVTFEEIDIEARKEAAAYLEKLTGRKAIPYAEVDGRAMIRGWHKEVPGGWSDDIFLAEVAQALA